MPFEEWATIAARYDADGLRDAQGAHALLRRLPHRGQVQAREAHILRAHGLLPQSRIAD